MTKRTIIKDINFYRQALKIELSKPFNKIDHMYARHLDNEIYKLKQLNIN
jgi:hypothetical protein